jgi:hypothetical protein
VFYFSQDKSALDLLIYYARITNHKPVDVPTCALACVDACNISGGMRVIVFILIIEHYTHVKVAIVSSSPRDIYNYWY